MMTCGKKHCQNNPTAATKVEHTEVEGRPRCDHAGCEQRVVGTGERCADGHVQGLRQGQREAAPPTYRESVEGLLNLLRETGSTPPIVAEEMAFRARQEAPTLRDATPAMQEAAAAVQDQIEQLIADESILERDGDHYIEVIEALALAYGDPHMPAAAVEEGAREGAWPSEEQVRAAAGPLFCALENLLHRQAEVLAADVDLPAIAQVLARGYGQPQLSGEQVENVVLRLVAMDEGADPEEDARVTLNALLGALRDLPGNWEDDLRTQAARAAAQRETRRRERAALTELRLTVNDTLDLLNDLDGQGLIVEDEQVLRQTLRAGWARPLVLSSTAEVEELLHALDGGGIIYMDPTLVSAALTTRHPGLSLFTNRELPAVIAHRDWNPTGDSMEQMLEAGGGELPAARDGYPIIYLTAGGNQLCALCAMEELRLPVEEEVYGVQGYRLLDEPEEATCCDECQYEFVYVPAGDDEEE